MSETAAQKKQREAEEQARLDEQAKIDEQIGEQIQARVLVDSTIDGHPCLCSQIISAEMSVIEPAQADGLVDCSQEGIDYVLSQGGEVIELNQED